jgi:hypothetical protein
LSLLLLLRLLRLLCEMVLLYLRAQVTWNIDKSLWTFHNTALHRGNLLGVHVLSYHTGGETHAHPILLRPVLLLLEHLLLPWKENLALNSLLLLYEGRIH